MENCIFCKIAKGEIPCDKVYEDSKTLAFLDINPVSEGHVLVIPKEHAEFFHELSDESAMALSKSLKKTAAAASEAFGMDYNILNNNGAKAGQAVKHVHFHIIPRRGHVNEFATKWPTFKYENGKEKEILKKLLQQMK